MFKVLRHELHESKRRGSEQTCWASASQEKVQAMTAYQGVGSVLGYTTEFWFVGPSLEMLGSNCLLLSIDFAGVPGDAEIQRWTIQRLRRNWVKPKLAPTAIAAPRTDTEANWKGYIDGLSPREASDRKAGNVSDNAAAELPKGSRNQCPIIQPPNGHIITKSEGVLIGRPKEMQH